MRYIWQHIETIIQSYTGGLPLAHYLKNYFRQHKKLGSRDRKILSDMAYSWYRCERGISNAILGFEERMVTCLYLCQSSKHVQQFIPETWRSIDAASVQQRIDVLEANNIAFAIARLFPYPITLSEGIDTNAWRSATLVQPHLFIRVRKDKKKIEALLAEAGIAYSYLTDTCLSLPNGTAIDKLLPPDYYVVQDASSQKTGTYFTPKVNEQWYDCCAGAGGKSLLLKDLQPDVQLTVSDRRASILHNLEERFRLYHHQLPRTCVVDVSNQQQLHTALPNMQFDAIICDAPCSGSGTWARTPEQLYFFDTAIIASFFQLQQTIAGNVAAHLKPGGRLLYITCSVFRQENEIVVDALVQQHALQVEHMQLINGIEEQADSMFIAVLKKG